MTTQFRLGDKVPDDAVWGACEALGLRLANVAPRSASHPAQSIFVSRDRQTMLHLLEDASAGRAVVFRGERAEAAAQAFVSWLQESERGSAASQRPRGSAAEEAR